MALAQQADAAPSASSDVAGQRRTTIVSILRQQMPEIADVVVHTEP